MAICVMAVVAVAPCQCFSPGGHQITSPGRIFSIGPPQLCTKPHPDVTIRVWPTGWVCHAVRAPGSNVTLTPSARAGAFAWNSGSMRTAPVKYSAGPLLEGCEPLFLMSMFSIPPCSELLARGPEQDLVHVHLLRLAHGEGDHACERLGGKRRLVGHLADALPDVGLSDP